MAPGIGGSVSPRLTTAGPPAAFTRKSTGAGGARELFDLIRIGQVRDRDAFGGMNVRGHHPRHPRSSSRATIEEPMPLAAPVTSARRPFSPQAA
jgi:hypothetical protein